MKYLVETDNTQCSYLAKTMCCTSTTTSQNIISRNVLLEMLYRIYTLLQFSVPWNH